MTTQYIVAISRIGWSSPHAAIHATTLTGAETVHGQHVYASVQDAIRAEQRYQEQHEGRPDRFETRVLARTEDGTQRLITDDERTSDEPTRRYTSAPTPKRCFGDEPTQEESDEITEIFCSTSEEQVDKTRAAGHDLAATQEPGNPLTATQDRSPSGGQGGHTMQQATRDYLTEALEIIPQEDWTGRQGWQAIGEIVAEAQNNIGS